VGESCVGHARTAVASPTEQHPIAAVQNGMFSNAATCDGSVFEVPKHAFPTNRHAIEKMAMGITDEASTRAIVVE
jgi:hypothetical protein